MLSFDPDAYLVFLPHQMEEMIPEFGRPGIKHTCFDMLNNISNTSAACASTGSIHCHIEGCIYNKTLVNMHGRDG